MVNQKKCKVNVFDWSNDMKLFENICLRWYSSKCKYYLIQIKHIKSQSFLPTVKTKFSYLIMRKQKVIQNRSNNRCLCLMDARCKQWFWLKINLETIMKIVFFVDPLKSWLWLHLFKMIYVKNGTRIFLWHLEAHFSSCSDDFESRNQN